MQYNFPLYSARYEKILSQIEITDTYQANDHLKAQIIYLGETYFAGV